MDQHESDYLRKAIAKLAEGYDEAWAHALEEEGLAETISELVSEGSSAFVEQAMRNLADRAIILGKEEEEASDSGDV